MVVIRTSCRRAVRAVVTDFYIGLHVWISSTEPMPRLRTEYARPFTWSPGVVPMATRSASVKRKSACPRCAEWWHPYPAYWDTLADTTGGAGRNENVGPEDESALPSDCRSGGIPKRAEVLPIEIALHHARDDAIRSGLLVHRR